MAKKRRQPRQTRSQSTVDRILDAVSHVICERGIDAVTTNHMAEAAGVSIGTLYQYFSNKQEIFNALHERQFQRMTQRVQTALAITEDGSLDDLLITLFDAVITERLEDPEMYRLLATNVLRQSHKMVETHPLSQAFLVAVASHRHELSPDCDLEQLVFVLHHMITALTNAVVLWRPSAITLEDARASAIAAIRAVVASHRKSSSASAAPSTIPSA